MQLKIGRLRGGFCVTWTEGGKRRRYRLDARDRAAAEAEALAVYRRKAARLDRPTVAAIWSAYIADRSGRPIATTMGHTGKAVLPFFGNLDADTISTDHCRQYTASRRATGRSDGTIWTELGHLRTALRWAAAQRIITHAPEIERPAKPKPKDRYLTAAEVTRLIDHAHAPHVRLAMIIMLATAARVGAVLDLTWDRVDFERRQINLQLPDATTRKGRAIVPINDWLMAALTAAAPAALSDYVIEHGGGPVKSVLRGVYAAADRAGLKGVSPHVLRHTAAVHMAAAGVPMDQISQYLGHSNVQITSSVYARFAPDHLRDAANVLDFSAIKSTA